jgi:hypothetical protein
MQIQLRTRGFYEGQPSVCFIWDYIDFYQNLSSPGEVVSPHVCWSNGLNPGGVWCVNHTVYVLENAGKGMNVCKLCKFSLLDKNPGKAIYWWALSHLFLSPALSLLAYQNREQLPVCKGNCSRFSSALPIQMGNKNQEQLLAMWGLIFYITRLNG